MKELYNNFKDEIAAVNRELLKNLPADIILLQDVFKYIFNAGGKRLRPLLTIAFSRNNLEICHELSISAVNDRDSSCVVSSSAEQVGNNLKLSLISKKQNINHSATCLAAAVELIHTATLLHDDVIDNANIRRNIPTANSIWDNKTSILVGDNMFSKAFQLIVESEKLKAFKELSDASSIISAAEVWQIQLLNKLDTSVNEYIRLVTDKTAVLFAAACAVGAIASDFSDEIVASAREFGLNFGILYQIKDDLLDYFGDEKKIGKETFQDIREGKMTIPLIMLLEAVSEDERKIVQAMIGNYEVDRELLSDLMKKYKIEKRVNMFAKKYRYTTNDIVSDHRLLKGLVDALCSSESI